MISILGALALDLKIKNGRKMLIQTSQENAFSPLCGRMCLVKQAENVDPQTSQENCYF